MLVKSVSYSITKQVRQYEPVRVEFTVEASNPNDTAQSMLEAARTLTEEAIIQAVQRGPVI